MATDYKLQILRVRDNPISKPLGGVLQQKAVDWTVDGPTIHTTNIPGEDFSADAALKVIRPQAEEVIKLLQTP
jgi:hypothetical protein